MSTPERSMLRVPESAGPPAAAAAGWPDAPGEPGPARDGDESPTIESRSSSIASRPPTASPVPNIVWARSSAPACSLPKIDAPRAMALPSSGSPSSPPAREPLPPMMRLSGCAEPSAGAWLAGRAPLSARSIELPPGAEFTSSRSSSRVSVTGSSESPPSAANLSSSSILNLSVVPSRTPNSFFFSTRRCSSSTVTPR